MKLRDWIGIARQVVPIIAEIAQTARSLNEARERLAIKAQAGDLDEAFQTASKTRLIITDYVERG